MNHLVVPLVVLFGLLIGLRGLHELLVLQRSSYGSTDSFAGTGYNNASILDFHVQKLRRPGAPRTTIWDRSEPQIVEMG